MQPPNNQPPPDRPPYYQPGQYQQPSQYPTGQYQQPYYQQPSPPPPKSRFPKWLKISLGVIGGGFVVLLAIGALLQATGYVPTAGQTATAAAQVAAQKVPTNTAQALPVSTPKPAVVFAVPTPTLGPTNTPRPTATALPTPNAQLVYASPTSGQPPATPAPAATPSGPKIGLELVGQTASDESFKVIVTGVDTYTVLNDSKGQPTIKPQGYFIVLVLDLENIGKNATLLGFMNIVDNKGRKFSGSSNVDAVFSVGFSGKYEGALVIQPGQKGKDYKLFEIPQDATGFKLTLGF